MPAEYEYELWQGGIMVASASSTYQPDAEREIRHYAMMYCQDGPCEIRGPIGPFCQSETV